MRWHPTAGVEVRLTELTAAVQSAEAKVDANQRVSEKVTEATLAQLQSLDRRVGEVRTEVDEVRKASATHLGEHAAAVNPHPNQEEWLRAHLAGIGREVSALATQITKWQGSLRAIGALYVLVTAVGTGVVVKWLGG